MITDEQRSNLMSLIKTLKTSNLPFKATGFYSYLRAITDTGVIPKDDIYGITSDSGVALIICWPDEKCPAIAATLEACLERKTGPFKIPDLIEKKPSNVY